MGVIWILGDPWGGGVRRGSQFRGGRVRFLRKGTNMRTRDLITTMWVGLVIAALTLGLVAVGVLLDHRQLRQDQRDLRAELDNTRAEASGLRTEREIIEEELRAQRERVDELSVQLGELKQRTEPKETAAAQPSYRIRAYLDNQWVSQGWLVPGRATTNSNGQLVYEPVVVLDPSARTALTESAPKKTVPTEPTSVTVNHNYPSSYGGVWPGVWVVSAGQKHRRPRQPPAQAPMQPQPQVQAASPFLSTRIWQPQTGFQQMARGRPGGEWISSAPRGHSYLSGGSARSALPVRH